MCNATTYSDQDGEGDKYTKSLTKSVTKSAKSVWTGHVSDYHVIWTCVMVINLFTALGYVQGGIGMKWTWDFVSMQLEVLGLALLREKIKHQQDVGGISGMTCVMHAVVYSARFVDDICCVLLNTGEYSNILLGMEMLSLLLVLDNLRSIFVTYQSTYEAQLDVMKAWYLIPGCVLAPFVVCPIFPGMTGFENYLTTCIMYMDAFALMPQVFMIAKSDGKIPVPVLNFVAATGVARSGDMFNTLLITRVATNMNNFQCFQYWINGYLDADSSLQVWSWLICVAAQLLQLILIADFLYHYFRARTWKNKPTEQINIAQVWEFV